MSVDAAIGSYGTFARRVFAEVEAEGAGGRFSASKMEQVIKEIVVERTGQENERMMGAPPHGKGCRT